LDAPLVWFCPAIPVIFEDAKTDFLRAICGATLKRPSRCGKNDKTGAKVMIAEKDRRIAEVLKKKLLAADGERIRRVILYGSRARGSAAEDSDFDFLVIEKDPVSKRDEMHRLRQSLSALDYPVDVWVMGEEEFEETREVIGGLAYPAHKYGIVLYENS
jgi:uncharacterized protein